jgi:hypothetical protein
MKFDVVVEIIRYKECGSLVLNLIVWRRRCVLPEYGRTCTVLRSQGWACTRAYYLYMIGRD